MDKMTQVLTGLVNRTSESKLAWRPTQDINSFVVSVDALEVVVKQVGARSRYGVRECALEILNDRGQTVAVLEAEDAVFGASSFSEERRELMRRLFSLARASALNAEETLSELSERLNAMA